MVNLQKKTPDYIFESSWEVCNKVGGIYTVLSTRAKTLQNLLKDKIIFIGPDLWKGCDNPEFTESDILLKEWKKQALENENLKVRIGFWNIPGKPTTVLVDFSHFFNFKDKIYYQMWEKYQIDSTTAYGDYDESCMFAFAVGRVIESLYYFLQLQGQNVIAHFNEWMLSMAALYIHDHLPPLATVFTTHATSIGRSICGNNKPLYNNFYQYNGDQMAIELNLTGKHILEKCAAHTVDCFTTVSEITGKECTQLLDKKPDVITPNGFEFNFVPKGKSFEEKRQMARKTFIRVAGQLMGLNFPENTFLLATAGRYEYKNKGIDVFIESVHRVRQVHPDRFIIAFILVPAWIKGPRKDLQKRLKQNTSIDSPLSDPYYTHDLFEPYHDKVIGYLHYLRFTNQDDSKVKIIFVPSYLYGNDGIFNLSYYDLLIGLDLTVFPSYYEPWGYTPLESIAFHIPTITTRLAGFGLWAETENAGLPKSGVQVLERTDLNYFEIAEKIKETILQYSTEYSLEQVKQAREAAFLLSKKTSWSYFIKYYLEAYNIALENSHKKINIV
jgi:glycogen synthase